MAQAHQLTHPYEALGQAHFLEKIDLPVLLRHPGGIGQGRLAQQAGRAGGLDRLQDAGMRRRKGVRLTGACGPRRGCFGQPAAQQQSRNQAPGQNFCMHA